jgi:Protein of unknown function (DUF2917)
MKNEYVVRSGSLAMTRGSLLRVEDGRELLIYVSEGALWLTQERDRRDRYLRAGEWFRLDRDGVAIAQATRRSTVTLTAPERASLAARVRRLWAGLFAPHARPTTASL